MSGPNVISQVIAAPNPAVTPDDAAVDLRRLLSVLWRRKTIISAAIILITGLTWIYVRQIPLVYTATSEIVIDTRDRRFTDIKEVISGISADAASIQSELEILTSRPLAEKVINRLDLARHREFNTAPEGTFSIISALKSAISFVIPDSWLDALRSKRGDRVPSEEEKLEIRRVSIVDAFIGRLEVNSIGYSTVIEISFSARDPRLAAAVVNTLADTYVRNTLEVKFEAARQASNWLNERLAILREDVRRSESAVERYRKSVGIIGDSGSSLVLRQTSQLGSELVLARSETARAASRLHQAEKLLGEGGRAQGVSEVLSSGLIQNLKQQQAALERQAAELSTEYGDKHPRMVNIRAEIEDLGNTIETEIRRIITSLRSDLRVAQAKEEALRANLDQMKTQASALKESEVGLRALEREAEADRLLLENFLSRFKETSIQQDIQQPDARVISRAEIPRQPASPRRGRILIIAVVLSATVGIAIAFAVEHLDAGFRTSDQLESLTGCPMVGVVPAIDGQWRSWKSGVAAKPLPEQYVLDRPHSSYAEALRSVHVSLMWSQADEAPKLVAITSALPGEGKSSMTMALARIRKVAGDRVLVLECDFRRPCIATALGIKEEPGLVDYVFGRAKLSDVIQRDPATGCDVIAHGHYSTDPSTVVQSEGMLGALKAFRERYDLVLIDTPPLPAGAEARMLAKLADATILLVRWGKTPRESVEAALRLLRSVDTPMIGTVLTRVNLRRQAQYGFGQYGFYYGQTKKYYQD